MRNNVGSRLESLVEMKRLTPARAESALAAPYKETPQPEPAPDLHRVPLDIVGQGAVAFEVKRLTGVDRYDILLKEQERGDWLVLVTIEDARITAKSKDGSVAEVKVAPGLLIGFTASSMFLWVSVDRANDRITVGHGYLMDKNRLLTLHLPPAIPRAMGKVEGRHEEIHGLAWRVRFVEIANQVEVASAKLVRMPITIDTPPKLVEHNAFTLLELAGNQATVASALPLEAQVLYGVVAGDNVVLDDSDAAAINYSISTEGMTLWKKLTEKRKKAEFGDGNMVYIRVTIGPNQGDSTGVPFVLEIWPSQCYSPVHNHGGTVAVIKVLHGSITVDWYNPLAKEGNNEDLQSLGQATFEAGQVTWITPEMYQTHKLTNRRLDTMCATIQCYRYLDRDSDHYEFFDYVPADPKAELGHFRPDSDFEYLELLTMVRWELEHHRPYPG